MTAADSRTDHGVLAEDHLTEAAEFAKANDYTRAIMASSMATAEAILALSEAIRVVIPEPVQVRERTPSDREVIDSMAAAMSDEWTEMDRPVVGMHVWRIIARAAADRLQSIGRLA